MSLVRWIVVLALIGFASAAVGQGVADDDKLFLEQASGMQLLLFAYLGAKHMVTGYDHLLFLSGVIFFLYRLKDVRLYVTLFAVGHSITLLTGVLVKGPRRSVLCRRDHRPVSCLQGAR